MMRPKTRQGAGRARRPGPAHGAAWPGVLLLTLACAGAPAPAPRAAPAAVLRPPADEGLLQEQLRGTAPGGVLSELPPERADVAHRERRDCAARLRLKNGVVAKARACIERAEQYASGTGVSPDAGLAAALLEQACVLKHWESCARLGLIWAEGEGVRASPERSAQLYWLACANGPIPAACLNLGLQYADGVGVLQSEPLAESYFERACQELSVQGCQNLEALRQARRERALAPERAARVPNASFRSLPADKAARIGPELLKCHDVYSRTHCNDLGVDYARGVDVARDEALAAAFFEQACHLGDSAACTNLTSAALAAQRRARPLASASRVLTEACEAGQAVACSELGAQALISARAEDDARALELLGRACEAGNAMGCTNLGWMHERGRGVRVDAARAGALYARGCAAGVALACRNEAVLQAKAAKDAQGLGAAARGYARACEGGDRRACLSLASLHATGLGTAEQQARSAQRLEGACATGDTAACVNLGHMHAAGRGVARSPARARALFEGACQARHAEACISAGNLQPDAAVAQTLFARACTLGLSSACGAQATGRAP